MSDELRSFSLSDPTDVQAVDNLKQKSGIREDQELMKTALQVYNYLVDQIQQGKEVYLGKGGKAMEVVTIPIRRS